MKKEEARKIVRQNLASFLKKDEASKIICQKIKDMDLQFKSIFLYKALFSEVNVDELIDLYKDNHIVYLPKVKGDDMVLIKVDCDTKYEIGPFNILEPIGDEISPSEAQIDVCITPLLGFDENLNRIGKGKGYYDKFFSKCKCKKIGVAFETQKIDNVEMDTHDVPLDLIITEDRIYANNCR